MLLYGNRSLARLICTYRGSVFWRVDNVLYGLILAAISAAVQYLIYIESPYAPELPHHYAIHALGVVVGFAVVFRTNLGWQRYWEGVTQLHIMYSKWEDAYSQVSAFCNVTLEQAAAKGTDDARKKCNRVRECLKDIEDNFLLLSALASDRLAHGDTSRMEKRATMARWSKQIAFRSDVRREDLTGARILPSFMTGGESNAASLGDANEWKGCYEVGTKPQPEMEQMLDSSSDRVVVALYQIVHGLAQASKDIDIAPPIQSRMYQELSNGMLGFNQAMKIADIPFPFPYAQLLTLLLIAFSLSLPIYIVCFTESFILGPIMTFVVFEGMWGVNEVAKELENPFGADSNDVSLPDFHTRFCDVIRDMRECYQVRIALQGMEKAKVDKLDERPLAQGPDRGGDQAVPEVAKPLTGSNTIADAGKTVESVAHVAKPVIGQMKQLDLRSAQLHAMTEDKDTGSEALQVEVLHPAGAGWQPLPAHAHTTVLRPGEAASSSNNAELGPRVPPSGQREADDTSPIAMEHIRQQPSRQPATRGAGTLHYDFASASAAPTSESRGPETPRVVLGSRRSESGALTDPPQFRHAGLPDHPRTGHNPVMDESDYRRCGQFGCITPCS